MHRWILNMRCYTIKVFLLLMTSMFMKRLILVLLVPFTTVLLCQENSISKIVEVKFPNGKLKASYSVVNDSIFHGWFKSWYPNGNRESYSNYDHGMLHGKTVTWYENGQKQYEGNYSHGQIEGTMTYWDTIGQKIRDEIWNNGDAKIITYFTNQSKKSEALLDHGVVHGEKYEWYETGARSF